MTSDQNARPSRKTSYNPGSQLGHLLENEIPVFQPHIGVDTVKAVVDALSVGWLGMGSVTREFEQEISNYLDLDNRYVVATNTGTSALHLALLLAGVGPNDEVITPSFNFVADDQAITATGAVPVFCDVREENLGIDCAKAEKLISPQTKAIMPLHYAGISCDIDGVYALAEKYRLRVIEDATHAFGTRKRGKPIGSFGDVTCFSFDPVKVVTSIDGGAVVVNKREDVEHLQHMRLLGIEKDTVERYKNRRAWEYDVVRQGFRYHLTNVNASIGLSQLRRADEFIANRQAYCRLYNEMLREVEHVVTPQTDYVDVSPFIYFIRVPSATRKPLMDHLREQGIATGIHFLPVHKRSFYRLCRSGDLSITDRIGDEIITLPLHSFMRRELIERIASLIKSFMKHAK